MRHPTSMRLESQEALVRLALTVCGVVQGVGFRPFIYRLATELHLAGWVLNSAQGIFIEVEGASAALAHFQRRLEAEKPPQASIDQITVTQLPAIGYTQFEIRTSDQNGPTTTLVPPDVATCEDCLHEIFDPTDRRYGYPFTNCTNCGPRYSIIERLPYDRPHTTMAAFAMCDACRIEYEDPANRRFHAQPNACPHCGPQLALWDSNGILLVEKEEALQATAQALRQGWVVGVKGLGGFHLMVDARSHEAVSRLRHRKQRPSKPFALMMRNLGHVNEHCELSTEERQLLASPAAPIVLLRRRSGSNIAGNVAPGNPFLGILLPYTPLHHLLMAEVDFPIVATSGNLSDEPICIHELEALERLHGIADFFLVHDRPIVRPVDDSVVRIMAGAPQILRRSRGYAPLPVALPAAPDAAVPEPILAVGGQLKNTMALAVGSNVFLSQHIGDLETPQSYEAFQQTIESLSTLYTAKLGAIACDAHPDYLATSYATERAAEQGVPLIKVQHHYAHILASMAEHGIKPPVLGLAWDGTGYGDDGTIWGGEFLLVDDKSYRRVAHLRQFLLPGGDAAVREPRRAALGLLFGVLNPLQFDWDRYACLQTFSWEERRILWAMLTNGLNTTATSSMGRLFDGVAALLGLHPVAEFEAQAAMALEFAAMDVGTTASYHFAVQEPEMPDGPLILDPTPIVLDLLADQWRGVAIGEMAGKFHGALIDGALNVANRIGVTSIVLSGGCFQNVLLTEGLIHRLRTNGFEPTWPQQIPPNDGGIALGQVVAAQKQIETVAIER